MAKTPSQVTLQRRFIGIGVLIALLPVLVFFLAYLYERGYAQALGIDAGNIDVSTNGVANAAVRFLKWSIVGVVVLQSVNFGMAKVEFRSRAVMYGYVIGEVVVLWLLAYMFLLGFTWSHLAKAGITLSVVLVAGVVLRALARRETPEEPSLGRMVARLIETGYFSIAAATLIASYAAYWSGNADGQHQKRFLVLQRDPSVVILRQYGDRLVGAHLRSHTIDRNSVIVLTLGKWGPGSSCGETSARFGRDESWLRGRHGPFERAMI